MINVEEVKVVRIIDPEKAEKLTNDFNMRIKHMEEFEEQMARWVNNVNNHMVTVDKSLDNIKIQNESTNEKSAEQFEAIQSILLEIRAEQKAHDEWHNKNKSFLSKVFGK